MMYKPIYMHPSDKPNLATYGEMNNEKVVTEIKRACQPFLPQLLQKMRNIAIGDKQKKD